MLPVLQIVPAVFGLRTSQPRRLLQLRRERVPVPQVPQHQLRREGPLPLQHLRLLQVRQVRVHPILPPLLRRRPDRERGRQEEGHLQHQQVILID